MKNIVIHEKLENGKMLLVAKDMPKVLYDEKECHVVGKLYKKKQCLNKDKLLNKLLRRVAIPLHKKIVNDDFISYLFCGEGQGACIVILSQKVPFVYILFEPILEHLNSNLKEMDLFNKSIMMLEWSLRAAQREAYADTIILETRSDRTIYCEWCGEWLEFNDFEDEQRKECKCGAVYKITLERVIMAEIREV